MAFDYTIDIQLTDLGFSDVLQTPEAPVRAGSLAASDPETQTATKPTIIRQQVEPDASSGTSAVCRASPQTTDIMSSPSPRQLDADSVQFVGAVAGGGLVVTSGAQSAEHLAGGDKPHEEAVNEGQEAKDAEESTDDSEDYDDCLDEDQDGLGEESEGDYRCSVCDLQLSSKLKLLDHMNLHTGQRPHCCAECGKRFCQLNNYRAHLKTHANSKPNAGSAPPPDPLRCRICRKGFESQKTLKTHLTKTHFEKEFYECDVCKRVFTDCKECEQHITVHMSNPGKFTCDKCGLRFIKQSTLQRHRARKCVHRFACTDCDQKFPRKTALLRHSFSHIGLLPYTCLRCSCHFRLPSLYRQHKCKPQRIHCLACLRGFDSQADFQKHKKNTGCWGHQEAKGDEILCPECGETFSSKEELRKHGGAHQRILTCDACGKGFRSALLLMSHMGGHASQAPCLCQTCGRGFLHQQDYSRHLDRCGLAPLPPKRAKKSSAPPRKPTPPPTPDPPVVKTVPRRRSQPKKQQSPKSKPDIPDPSPGNQATVGPWLLSLAKPPPQGVNLVLLVPMSTPLAAGLGPALPGVMPPPGQPVLLPAQSPAALPTVPQIMLPDLVANKTDPHGIVIKTESDPAAASIVTEVDPAAVSIKTEADPAAASIITEADPAAFSIKTDDPTTAIIMTEADPAAVSIKTEADPAAANIMTEADPAAVSIKTDDDPAAASIKMEAEPAAASIKTEADPAAASIQKEADPAAVGIKAPIVRIALQPKYCLVILRRLSDKELKR